MGSHENKQLPLPSAKQESPERGSGQGDPLKVKEFWTDVVIQAERKGKLEKIPTRLARTKRERAQAQAQNAVIFRRSFGGFGENYDNIRWKSRLGSNSESAHPGE